MGKLKVSEATAKAVPSKEMKGAIKDLNSFLKEEEQPTVKFVGVKKHVALSSFLNTVVDYIEEDRGADLPESAIDLYNDHLADNAEEEGDAKPDKKGKKGKKPAKGAKGKKADKKADKKPAKGKKADKGKAGAKGKKGKGDKKPAKKEKKGLGKVEAIVRTILDDGVDTGHADVQTHLKKKYKVECSTSTISHVSCVLGHLGDRLK